MVKNSVQGRRRARRAQSFPQAVGEDVFKLLKKMGGSPKRANVADLWQNWSAVMGAFAEMGAPGGHRDNVLILEVEDAMQLQELHMRSEEVLEKANAYLQNESFTQLRLELKGRRARKKPG